MSTTTEVAPVMEEMQLKRHEEEAAKIVRNYTIAAAGSGLIPFSILSGAATTGVQVMMIKDLCQLFNVEFDQKVVSTLITSIIGSALIQGASMAISAGVPGVVNPMKGLSGAALSGVYTATVGEFYKVHFQKGGSLDDASIMDIGNYFRAEIENGDISMSSIANPVSLGKRIMNWN